MVFICDNLTTKLTFIFFFLYIYTLLEYWRRYKQLQRHRNAIYKRVSRNDKKVSVTINNFGVFRKNDFSKKTQLITD